MKKLIILGLMFILSSYLVSAVCTQTGVRTNSPYSNGETVTATVNCGASDKGDAGYYLWLNGSNVLIENDTFTIPSSSPFIVFPQLIINSSLSPHDNFTGSLYVNGAFISNSTFNTTSTGGVNILDIVDVETTTDIFEGKTAGIRGVIKNQGKLVGYADVCLDVLDEDNEPFQHIGCKKSEVDGQFFFSARCDGTNWCTAGASYLVDIDASCPKNSSSYISCFNEDGDELDFANGGSSKSITVVDIEDRMIVKKQINDTVFGVNMRNQFGAKTHMEKNPSIIFQEDINWVGFNNTKTNFTQNQTGEAYLTAGELFSPCYQWNNTFDDELLVTVMNPTLDDDDLGQEVRPLDPTTKEPITGIISIFSIKPFSEEGVLQEKCGEFMLLPTGMGGSNDWDYNFQYIVEGYTQLAKGESEEFNVFGERRGKDYIDFFTINSIKTISTNGTELEFFQAIMNITVNIPDEIIPIEIHYTLFRDFSLPLGTETIVQPVPFNNEFPKQESQVFVEKFDLTGIKTDIIKSPKFTIPTGIIDNDKTKVMHMNVDFLFGDLTLFGEKEFQFEHPEGDSPNMSIIGKAFEINNISTSLNGTKGNACDAITYSINYTNILSNVTRLRDERFILHICVEDTTNDIYLKTQCTNIKIEPDNGISHGSFTTTIPYISSLTQVEAELDIWVYDYDVDATGGDCTNCGEVVDFFSGEEGAFNISPTLTDACRFKNTGIQGEDKALEVQFIQGDALQGIENKTGIFHFDIGCPSGVDSTEDEMTCSITGFLERGNVKKEVDFTCFLDGGRSSLNFEQMVDTTPSSFNVVFPLFDLTEGFHTATCKAKYYHLGSRVDTFSDSFFYGVIAGGTSGSSIGGARSGGCWALAKDQNTCYYTESSACVKGCPGDLVCNMDYDFSSVNSSNLDFCVQETILEKPNVIKETLKKLQDMIKENGFIGGLIVVGFVMVYITASEIKKSKKGEKDGH